MTTVMGLMHFTYDMSDQPVAMTGDAPNTRKNIDASYLYDGNMKRVRSIIDSGDGNGPKTIYNVYDAAGRLVHVDEEGGGETDYLHGMGQTLARIKDDGNGDVFTYLHPDHLGSPQLGTKGQGFPLNEQGEVDFEEHYTPFGEALLNPAANDNQSGFTGHIKDKGIGLNYMQARYYDPNIGRFLSIDPVSFAGSGGNPTYFNRYAYVGNDPVNLIDPTGMIIECADSGSCTNEGGTELFNLSSISNDANRATVGSAINSLSETGDFQSDVEGVVAAAGSSIQVYTTGAGSRSRFQDSSRGGAPSIGIGREGVNYNYRVSASETNSVAGSAGAGVFADAKANNQRTFFGGVTAPVTVDRLVAHETEHLNQLSRFAGPSVGGTGAIDEASAIRSTNSLMYQHSGQPARAPGVYGRRLVVRKKP